MPQRSQTAARILREATRLFARQGYERTSVPDIQEAAGLSPGSGALYKHFSSKESVLRAIVAQFIAEARAARTTFSDLHQPPRQVLEWIGRAVLRTLAEKTDELRILWRELDPFPSLRREARRELMQATYQSVAVWLRDGIRRGEIPEQDPEAAAAVLIGSLAMFRVFEAIWGTKTIDVSDDRFLEAWLAIASRGVGLA
jgi:AcrR family transcriptional regulator